MHTVRYVGTVQVWNHIAIFDWYGTVMYGTGTIPYRISIFLFRLFLITFPAVAARGFRPLLYFGLKLLYRCPYLATVPMRQII